VDGWFAFFEEFDAIDKARKNQSEHDKVMNAAAKAARG